MSLGLKRVIKNKYFWFSLLFLIMPIIEIIIYQYLLYEDLDKTENWFIEQPINFLVTYLLIISCQILIFLAFNDLYIGFMIPFIVFTLLNVINYYKVKILGEGLFPWDFLLANEMVKTVPTLIEELNLPILISGLVIVILIIISFFIFPKTKINWKARGAILVVFGVLLSTYFVKKEEIDAFLIGKKVGIMSLNPNLNMKWNGVLYNFYIYIPKAIIEKPNDYSLESVEQTYNHYEKLFESNVDSKFSNIEDSDKKPNVIMVMSEAYYDITKFQNLELEESIMSNTQKYMNSELLSPKFGAGTAQVEWEALTGMSNNFIPEGASPYQIYIKDEILSLPNTFKNEGYDTFALHTYAKWYWNREKAYKLLGFDNFIAEPDLPKDVDRYGQFIDDSVVNHYIKEHIQETKKPTFIFAVTMQNHTPYTTTNYSKEQQVAFNREDYSTNSRDKIGGYINGIANTDKQLGDLIEYVQDLDEPTILVYFGDHLPTLGTNYSAYLESGFIQNSQQDKWSLEEKLNMRKTPLLIMNNFGGEVTVPKLLTPSFLPYYILENSNIEIPKFFKFLKVFSDELPGFVDTVKVDNKYELFDHTPEELKELEKDYKLFQYDILFGEKYYKQIEKN